MRKALIVTFALALAGFAAAAQASEWTFLGDRDSLHEQRQASRDGRRERHERYEHSRKRHDSAREQRHRSRDSHDEAHERHHRR